jgi:ABC-2 type transport system permease protein/sodium transport system permease protein
MTITGAVYPAIDLTAGERERGTMELLVAAPVSRMQVLLAKYCAVLLVALLTATVNLLMMGLTLSVSGLGAAVLGERGIPPRVILAIFGLLVLFAAFFSAVLLAITSFARSFKEAQAYLIPLMLLAMAPGFVSLLPGVELSGPLQMVPLLNVVLLARDLLEGGGDPLTAVIVVVTTLLYAVAALSIAARIFGTDAVLNVASGDWSDLFRRRIGKSMAVSLPAAMLTAAFAFPLQWLLNAAIGRFGTGGAANRLGLAAVVQVGVFAGLPVLMSWVGNVRRRGLAPLGRPGGAMLLGSALLGLSLWLFTHELMLILRQMGFGAFELDQLRKYEEGLSRLRAEVSPAWLVLVLAILPALTEELFFRGFVFGAIRSKQTAARSIAASALLFGLFHLVTTNQVIFERFVASTLLGFVLGWLRARSGSLLPGIVLHACHNGLLISLFAYRDQLKALGIGAEEQSHLPAVWLLVGSIAGGLGFLLAGLSPGRPEPVVVRSDGVTHP